MPASTTVPDRVRLWPNFRPGTLLPVTYASVNDVALHVEKADVHPVDGHDCAQQSGQLPAQILHGRGAPGRERSLLDDSVFIQQTLLLRAWDHPHLIPLPSRERRGKASRRLGSAY